jgi:hypothetical protein
VEIEYFIPADQLNHLPVGHFLSVDLDRRVGTSFNAGQTICALVKIKTAWAIDVGREAPFRADIDTNSAVIAFAPGQPELNGTRLTLGG